jgi:uncharacterized LabA/DUF88 family protein
VLDNYYFLDGSALMAQIRRVWAMKLVPAGSKLCPLKFVQHFQDNLTELHEGQFKRATFYFPNGDDEAVSRHIFLPDFRKSGQIRDISIKYCGQKIKKSKKFDEFVENTVPQQWRDRFSKSEKGVDLEICCDALRLASFGKMERAFLLTNDDDFVPFCRTIKEFGANISLLHLTDKLTQNISLLQAADSYDVVDESELASVFEISGEIAEPADVVVGTDAESDLKPDVAPSDLAVIGDTESLPIEYAPDEKQKPATDI